MGKECLKPLNPYFVICLHVMGAHPLPSPYPFLSASTLYLKPSFVTERDIILLPEARIIFFASDLAVLGVIWNVELHNVLKFK
jgi:hypothetical protein